MRGQIKIRWGEGKGSDKAFVDCPDHGTSEMSRRKLLERLMTDKANPCTGCAEANKLKVGDFAGSESAAGDPYARKYAGWRLLVFPDEGESFLTSTFVNATVKKQIEKEIMYLSPGENILHDLVWHHDNKFDPQWLYFPNKLEANYFRILNEQEHRKMIRSFEHQPKAFDFSQHKTHGTTRYRPDFWVQMPDKSVWYIETKGRMDSKSITKLRLVKKHLPEVRMRIVTWPKTIHSYAREFPAWEWVSYFDIKKWAALCPGWEA